MKRLIQTLLTSLLLLQLVACINSTKFTLHRGLPITILYDEATEQAATTHALQLLLGDIESVLSVVPKVIPHGEGDIIIGTLGKSPTIQSLVDSQLISTASLVGKSDAFILQVVTITHKPTLVVVGSDRRGTAYGLLEISRLLGVSPWEWWADVTPAPRKQFTLPANFEQRQSPSVPYRGIFLNDEDWGLMPWSSHNYEPGLPTLGGRTKGTIGPKTYERIFQLLLRLRANTIWPAMHECTVPFALVEGNLAMAHQYAIFVGGSHCEPMMRSVAGEWPVEGVGAYDYVTNSEQVYTFFEKRVADVAHMDNLYTLGMRGEHDGAMQGAKTLEEQKAVLARVLQEQRHLLKQYVNEDLTQVPQLFIPYKEVLDVYHTGLEVPDEVTLVWCDDNYGYIKHFPTEQEAKRKGGNGMYYHVSYWGRPHDYLWLGTASPGLLYQQMSLAYEKGVQQFWILNVGDIKPCEYQTELFLDMAWNFEEVTQIGITNHLKRYLQREFGQHMGQELLPIMQEHYRLAYIRKPEFMGNTREEERTNPLSRVVKDLPWSEKEINERLRSYREIASKVEKMAKKIPAYQQDAFFELIKYPVQAAAQMNVKMLTAQLARHGQATWVESDAAYDSIVSLTNHYNTLAGGKWRGMMDYQPRKLPPFNRVTREEATTSLPTKREPLQQLAATDYSKTSHPQQLFEELGYNNQVVAMKKGSSLSYAVQQPVGDSVAVAIHLLPNHPVGSNQLRIEVAFEGETPVELAYQTYGRSEEWKENVLRNQAIRTVVLPVKANRAMLHITALDEGVVLDQITISHHP